MPDRDNDENNHRSINVGDGQSTITIRDKSSWANHHEYLSTAILVEARIRVPVQSPGQFLEEIVDG